jgi:hypothetical protein
MQARERAWRVVAAAAVAVALFAERDVPLWFKDRLAASWAVYHRPGYLVEDEIAAYIRQTTAPDDTMAVAFWEAGIQALAERQGSRPYLYFDQYRDSPRAYREVTDTIVRRMPAVVVWVNDPPEAWASAGQFQAVLDEAGYRPARQFGSVAVYKRQ